MEEQKNHETEKQDHNECCCRHHSGIRILIKVAVILAVFLIGICFGAKVSSHANRFYFNDNIRQQHGCPMMRGEIGNGSCLNKAIAPVNTEVKVLETTTTTR